MHFYPRPPRGGRQHAAYALVTWMKFLSTPSARRATLVSVIEHKVRDISIHALREKGDKWLKQSELKSLLFLSTPSARRATAAAGYGRGLEGISIHALREEGDDSFGEAYRKAAEFLSTPSARRATAVFDGVKIEAISISIHALREEGDTL